jgi:recombination protein RecA
MAIDKSKQKDVDDILKDTLKSIQKQFGEGAVMKLGDRTDVSIDTFSSGSMQLDLALGVGGYPRGRIIEVYGPESSGKTTVALHAIAEVQKLGGRAAFIDAEHAIDPGYAKKLGVKIEELILSQPDSGEQAMEIADLLVKSGAIDLIVVDSVAALVPQAELEGEMMDAQMGMQARLMSKALRKIAGNLNRTSCSIIFINQLREKVGIMFGNPEVTPGGRALKFYSTIRLEVRRTEAIKEGTELIGNKVTIKVVKNKVAPPFRSAAIEILYGQGISREGELLDLAVQFDLLKKAGAWYEYAGERMGQGRDAAKNYLLENPLIAAEVREKVNAKLFEKKMDS